LHRLSVGSLLRVRVLLAHASAATRRRLGDTLRETGHEVIEASDAAEALVLCGERRPDVLLASTALCERDRIDLLGEVKSAVEVFRTAVVLIAPRGLSAQDAREQLRRGAQDFLLEPVADAELIARVQAAGRMKILQEELVDQTTRMESRVFEDPLTRLYNRRFLFSQLGALVSASRRHGRPLAVAMADLDAFKAVNDSHGHETGDRVLAAAAAALARALRAEDVLGRLGGEEFLALLPDTGEEAASHAAERLRAAVQDVGSAGGLPPVTASVGWAVLAGGDEPDDLVRRADMALYSAKAAGRNRVGGPATLPRRR
jgi:two-component system cell cycle response regulator